MLQKTYQNGLRLVGEQLPNLRSVCLGIYIPVGAAHESAAENGMSHLLEHMVFKGTEKYTSRDIANRMDEVGGVLNAYTTRECTCLYARLEREELPRAMDILTEMAFRASLTAGDLAREKDVIFEEIAMKEDAPDEVAEENLYTAVFGETGLGRSILGTKETLEGVSAPALRAYYRRHYQPRSMVISAVGSFEPETLEALAAPLGEGEAAEPQNACPESLYRPVANTGRLERTRPVEQAHLFLSFPGLAAGDPAQFDMAVLNNILGGGMSSRLFQKIREELGLAYEVQSYHDAYAHCGLLCLYAGMNRENVDKVRELILQETEAMRRGGFTEEEISRAVHQTRGNFILSRESVHGRMLGLARRTALELPMEDEETLLARISKVNRDSLTELAARCLKPEGLCSSTVLPGA